MGIGEMIISYSPQVISLSVINHKSDNYITICDCTSSDRVQSNFLVSTKKFQSQLLVLCKSIECLAAAGPWLKSETLAKQFWSEVTEGSEV